MTGAGSHASVRAGAMIAGLAIVLARPEPATSQANPLVADLSEHLISITSNFTGTNLLLFGSIVGVENADIIVVVRGPEQEVVVRRKDKVAGIWVNRDAVVYKKVPGYYAVAANRTLREITSDRVLDFLQIGAGNLRLKSDAELTDAQRLLYKRAIVRDRMRKGLYLPNPQRVTILGNSLFRTAVHFPATVPVGPYTAAIYLFREGQIIGAQTAPLDIRKFGIERAIFDFAHQQPLIYGVAAVLIALIAGWLASVIFRRG